MFVYLHSLLKQGKPRDHVFQFPLVSCETINSFLELLNSHLNVAAVACRGKIFRFWYTLPLIADSGVRLNCWWIELTKQAAISFFNDIHLIRAMHLVKALPCESRYERGHWLRPVLDAPEAPAGESKQSVIGRIGAKVIIGCGIGGQARS